MLKLLRILMSGVLFLTCICTFAVDEGKIIAVYGDAVSQTTPPPGWNFYWNAQGNVVWRVQNGIFKTVFFLDIGDKLVEPDGTIRSDVMPDKLHVAMPGYIRWMDAMKPTLDTLLNNQ